MCGRVEHQVCAVAHGATAAVLMPGISGLPPVVRVAVAVLAGVAAAPWAGGRWSPDIDQTKIWKDVLDRRLPDEWLGAGGPLRHRGVTHWWAVPAVGTALVVAGSRAFPTGLGVLLAVAAWPVLAGWWSHLLSDWVVGAAYRGGRRAEADDTHAWDRKSMLDADDEPRGPGIPLLPWWGHVGLGHKVGSLGEWVWVLGSVAVGVAAAWAASVGVVVTPPLAGWVAVPVVLAVVGVARPRRSRVAAGRRAGSRS